MVTDHWAVNTYSLIMNGVIVYPFDKYYRKKNSAKTATKLAHTKFHELAAVLNVAIFLLCLHFPNNIYESIN